MKKLRLAVAVALVASFSVLASSSAQAQNYPVAVVTVSEDTVTGGDDITITATATLNGNPVDCIEWTLEFMGDQRTGSGTSITETFSTPEVDEEQDEVATATCLYDDGVSALGSGGSRTAGASLATVEQTATGTGTQTLLPEDDDGDGDNGGLLPNTGGERLAWLIIGLLLVLVGGGVYMASRQREA